MRPYNVFEAGNAKYLVDNQVQFVTLQITETGLKKSIMDATAPVRAYLKEHGLHDYETQTKGELGKRLIDTFILTRLGKHYTKTSLYRPLTKNGDPRIWINKVKGVGYFHPNDIFAIIAYNRILYVINLSSIDIQSACNSPITKPVQDLIGEISAINNSTSAELLGLIRDRVSEWTPAECLADTGIGRTIETILGIPMNADKTPDYKGIELKSHRSSSKVRNTLFTQSPDWQISRLKSGKEIVDAYGYVTNDSAAKTLHVTLSASMPNQQCLGLLVVPATGLLEAAEFGLIGSHYAKTRDVAAWRLSYLHERLMIKHRETFWIDVETKRENGREYFRCTEILHTKNPIPSQFDVLLEQGQITVDFLLCRRSGGDTYSFKIKSGARGLLFPQSETYII